MSGVMVVCEREECVRRLAQGANARFHNLNVGNTGDLVGIFVSQGE